MILVSSHFGGGVEMVLQLICVDETKNEKSMNFAPTLMMQYCDSGSR